MTTCKCEERSCENYDPETGKCKLSEITINYDHECGSYYDYTDTDAYDAPYYQARCVKGKTVKRASKGKRIEYNGYVFFTEEDDRYGDDFWVTEERTGAGLSFGAVKYKFDEFAQKLEKYPDVREHEDERHLL